jgi:hypothetical protein
LLCRTCNTRLGHLEKRIDLLPAMLAYLEKHVLPAQENEGNNENPETVTNNLK